MALLTSEYAVHCLDASSGEVTWRRGPYASIELAEESIYGHDRSHYLIMERSLTDWEPVPTEPPAFIPEDD
jgi:hypothetical protein